MTLDDVLEARARNWVGVSEVEFADHMAWLIDRVGKLERAHAWFVDYTNDYKCGFCGARDVDTDRHYPSCELVKAKDLKL